MGKYIPCNHSAKARVSGCVDIRLSRLWSRENNQQQRGTWHNDKVLCQQEDITSSICIQPTTDLRTHKANTGRIKRRLLMFLNQHSFRSNLQRQETENHQAYKRNNITIGQWDLTDTFRIFYQQQQICLKYTWNIRQDRPYPRRKKHFNM